MKTFTVRNVVLVTAATAALFGFAAAARADDVWRGHRSDSTSIEFDLQVGSHGSGFGISVNDYDGYGGHGGYGDYGYRPVPYPVVNPGHVHVIGGPVCHVVHEPVFYRPAPVIVHHGFPRHGYAHHPGHFGGHGRGGWDNDRGHGRGGHDRDRDWGRGGGRGGDRDHDRDRGGRGGRR